MARDKFDYKITKDGFFIFLTLEEIVDMYDGILTEEDILKLKMSTDEQSTSSGSSKRIENKS